jgi:hypothetical protein
LSRRDAPALLDDHRHQVVGSHASRPARQSACPGAQHSAGRALKKCRAGTANHTFRAPARMAQAGAPVLGSWWDDASESPLLQVRAVLSRKATRFAAQRAESRSPGRTASMTACPLRTASLPS